LNVKERIEKLRGLMEEKKIDVYVVPTSDFHQSEYVGEHFKARKYITGFSGSAGTAVITKTEARLWTDGRYFIQAAAQLNGSGVELMKIGEPEVPELNDYLAEALPEGGVLGFDGRVVSMGDGEKYAEIAAEKKGSVEYSYDLIGDIWEDRPGLSEEPAFLLDIKYTGESTADKLKRIREVMEKNNAGYHVVTTLDDICWTLNIRGNDIEFFPLVLSYAIITMDKVILYINEKKLDDAIRAEFAANNVEIRPYNDIYEDIKALDAGESVMIDPSKLNYALYSNIPAGVTKVEEINPEIIMKAIKNPVEIENIRQAQIKDSVAHVRFMKWLKDNIGKTRITEMSAPVKLDEFRAEMGNFIRPSFEPISSVGEHAALCHYTSSPETDVELGRGQCSLPIPEQDSTRDLRILRGHTLWARYRRR
jgi:Xaa-Pro aminopeptidase